VDRKQAIETLTQSLLSVRVPHPIRAGIDGMTAAGKTMLADELAEALREQPRQVIRATVDDFHNPPDMRYRRGRMSPDGYYLDTFDYPSLRSLLLGPLGPDGSRRYRLRSFGQPDGTTVRFDEGVARDDAILLLDGVFLFRPELNDCWDYRIFIEVDSAVALERGLARDAGWMGSDEIARERYEKRYVPGERLYLDSVRPWELADAIVGNTIVTAPELRLRA
jgi:uridine kinase